MDTVSSRVKDEVALHKEASSVQPEAEVVRGKAASESAENEGKHGKTISFQLPALIFLVSVVLAAFFW